MTDENEIDYGPLTALLGTWTGDTGLDISPEPEPGGVEESPYYETIVYEAAGDVDNAETQNLRIVRYHQEVRRKSNDEVFHDQVGYWLWDADARAVMHSLVIPRGVAVVMGGEFAPSGAGFRFQMRAKAGDPDWGIVESPFMRDNARTVSFVLELTVDGDDLFYSQASSLEIYGRSFEHTDVSTLRRVRG